MDRFTGDAAVNERLELARGLACRVGRDALEFREVRGRDALGTKIKSLQDFVTEADLNAERTIRSELAHHFPEDGFLGEETGGAPTSAGYWVVDPIDGTANFLRGLRHWGVSIAYVADERIQLGVVYDPPNDLTYHARAGQGAFCNDRSISVSGNVDPHTALGIVGVSRRTGFDRYLGFLRVLHDAAIEHRRIGSAAIGLARVADGVADFYYEAHLNCWDALAGMLIAQEAGARVIAPPLERFTACGGAVLCGVPAMVELIDALVSDVRGSAPYGEAAGSEATRRAE